MGARRGATCPVCEKHFAQAYSLTIHMRIHNGEKPFACSTCGRRFTQAHSRTKHERIHTGEKQHECHVCGKRFGEAFMLKRHMRVHTGDKPFRCLECGRAFSDKFGLTRHLKTHVTVKAHVCNECGQSFSNAWALATHQLQHMGINHACLSQGDFSGIFKRRPGDTGPVTPEAAAILQAQAQAQAQQAQAQVHAQVQVQPQLQIQIQIQPPAQPQSNQLQEAKKPKMHVCLVCGKAYADAWGLSKHSWIHTGIKPYSCSECGKGYQDKWGLTKHMRVHSGDRPFECFLCGQSYNDKSSLQSHLRVHTGEKPYICDLCGKCFAASRALDEHRATHGDREQHTCPVCTRIFMTKRGVNEHWKKYCGKNNPAALGDVTCVGTVSALCTVEMKQDQDLPGAVTVTVPSSGFGITEQAQADARVQVQVHQQPQSSVNQTQQAETPKEMWAQTAHWTSSNILEVPSSSSSVKSDQKMSPCYVCDICHKTYKQVALLEKHKLTHSSADCTKSKEQISSAQPAHSEPQHRCHLCDKSFMSQGCLKSHLDSGCTPKACIICGKAVRVLTIEGAQIVTPYCDTCTLNHQHDTRSELLFPKRFWAFDASHLTFQKHLTVHSDGSKPCSCGHCDGMFSSHTAIASQSLNVPSAGV